VVVDCWPVDDNRGIYIVDHVATTFALPVIDEGELRRARAGDYFITAVPRGHHGSFSSTITLNAPVVSEERIEVDQTNESFVLNNTWIIKWNMTVGSHRTLTKERRLSEHHYPHTAAHFGHITWTSPDNSEHLLAGVQEFLPGSVDGWTWCVAHAKGNNCDTWPGALGEVVALMHNAFDGTTLAHGDLHVGQILNQGDSYYIIDFDGDPLGHTPESWLQDVVGMLCSFIHVAAVAEVKYHAAHDFSEWVRIVSDRFLETYLATRPGVRLPPRDQLLALMAHKEVAEMLYATTYLPEWTYAAEYGHAFVERLIDESQ